jgi:hypothetical protein
MKFPLILFQGTDGIAVGLSTKILPHNFNELIKGSIDILKGKKTKDLSRLSDRRLDRCERVPERISGRKGEGACQNRSGGQKEFGDQRKFHLLPLPLRS